MQNVSKTEIAVFVSVSITGIFEQTVKWEWRYGIGTVPTFQTVTYVTIPRTVIRVLYTWYCIVGK